MHGFADYIIKMAYKDLAMHSTDVTAADLVGQVDYQFMMARETLLLWWASRAARRPNLHLLYDRVLPLVEEVSTDVYRDMLASPDDEESRSSSVAFALAVLRWSSLCRSGRAPDSVSLTYGEAVAWLAKHATAVHRNPAQMSLFLGV